MANSIFIDDIVWLFRDVDTGMIFKDPIMGLDGQVHERTPYILKLRQRDQTLTFDQHSEKFPTVYPIFQLIQKMVSVKPDLQNQQYSEKKQYSEFKDDIINILQQKQYERLEEFTGFLLNDCQQLLTVLVEELPLTLFKYVVNNCLDIDDVNPVTGNTLIHEVCSKKTDCSTEKCLHVMSKNVNLKRKNNQGYYPLDLVLIHQEYRYKIVVNMIQAGVDIMYNDYNDADIQPIHFLMSNLEINILNTMIEKGVDPNVPMSNGMLPIHILLSFAKFESIKDALNSDIKWNFHAKYNDETCIGLIWKNCLLTDIEKYSAIQIICTKIVELTVETDKRLIQSAMQSETDSV